MESEERRWCHQTIQWMICWLRVAGCGFADDDDVLLQFAVFHTCFGQLLV